ncbi:Threonine dehydrogenase [Micromonospora nigra]|uniref:Threonine dehydrogenase n=1 Tax=Micromonospora nigra TaxID=145857 RepID=A0A1C6RD04_9ACTN|nr:zinc-binding dehydrogenase [Micromonospora nigra]SCL15017.1 Threonine dehydrogenase [Micromonospora nigra]
MRAVLARGPGRFELVDLAAPVPPPGGRILQVEATGVCAADRMLWNGTGPWQVCWPFVPGHEILGRDILTGERLTVEVKIPCGRCRFCTAGRTNLCPHGTHLGSGLPGGFAERIALPASAVTHPVPEELPRDAAVLAEPMACAVHAVRRAAVAAGDTVAVIGLGAVGALAVIAARARSAGRVVAVVRSDAKAEVARALGAEPVPVRPVEGGSPRSGVDDLDGRMDVVIECSGDPDAAALALRLAAPGGRVCLYGVYPRPAALDLNQIAEFKELTVTGGHLAPGCFPEAIALLPHVPADLLVTGVWGLTELPRALGPAQGPRIKEVVVP